MPAFLTFNEKLALVWSASRVPDPTIEAFPGMSMVSGFKPVILACVELDPQSVYVKATVSPAATPTRAKRAEAFTISETKRRMSL